MKQELIITIIGLLFFTSIAHANTQPTQSQSSIELENVSLSEERLKDDFFQTSFLTSDVLKEEANERFYKENFLVSDETKEIQNEKNFTELFIK